MLVDTLLFMSTIGLGLTLLSLLLVLAGRFLTAAALAIIALLLNYVVAVGWMNPQVIAGVNTVNQTAVITTLSDERTLSSLFQGLVFLDFALFGISASGLLLGLAKEEEGE